MEKTITYFVGPENDRQTVEQFLRKKGYSHHLLVGLKADERGLTISGRNVHTNRPLAAGETLTVRLVQELPSRNVVPSPMDLRILYEDDDILVVDKKAGIPVHPSQGNYENTLANGLAWYFLQKRETFFCRPVNRLDKNTSGLILFAKHLLSACILSDLIKDGRIIRGYLAIASGRLPSRGTVKAPIARVQESAIERCVHYDTGKPALTRYRRLFYNPGLDLSLAALLLDTGRTHQIRVHMRHIGHPLPGDFLYYPDFTHIDRQALHSGRLEFPHPLTKESLCFSSPLPEDMRFIGLPDGEVPWDNDF